jgi:hypothetical protein
MRKRSNCNARKKLRVQPEPYDPAECEIDPGIELGDNILQYGDNVAKLIPVEKIGGKGSYIYRYHPQYYVVLRKDDVEVVYTYNAATNQEIQCHEMTLEQFNKYLDDAGRTPIPVREPVLALENVGDVIVKDFEDYLRSL